MIRDHLEIEPVFIPELPGHTLAHSDDFVAFVDEQTAVVSQYPISYSREAQDYVNSIANKSMGPGVKVVRSQENPVCQEGA